MCSGPRTACAVVTSVESGPALETPRYSAGHCSRRVPEWLVASRALLISTYDLGHQPFGLASPAAWLRREGLDVSCVDLSKEKLAEPVVAAADLIAFHLP